jgi:hypothetical protein
MGWNDHMPTEDDFAAVAIEAGAIEVCRFHTSVTVNKGDPEANKRAYAIATNKWKVGGLLGDREEIMDGIKNAIEMAPLM